MVQYRAFARTLYKQVFPKIHNTHTHLFERNAHIMSFIHTCGFVRVRILHAYFRSPNVHGIIARYVLGFALGHRR